MKQTKKNKRKKNAKPKALKSQRLSSKKSTPLPFHEQNLLIALVNQRRYIEAIEQATTLTKPYPKAEMLYLILGAANNALLRRDEAIKYWLLALKVNPNNADLHNDLGAMFLMTGETKTAIKHFSHALKINPGHANARSNLGNALFTTGKPEAAIEHFKRVLKINPGHAIAHNNLGNALQTTGEIEAAIEHLKRALKLNPDYADAHNNLGNALQTTGEIEAAIEHYKRALKLNPDYVDAHNNLGNALHATGEVEAAIEHYNRALKVNPDHVDAHCGLGLVLRATGSLDAATMHLSRALEIKPDDPQIYRNYAASHKIHPDDPHLPTMMNLLDRSDLTVSDQMHLNFAVGKASLDLGDAKLGIECLLKGNAIRKKELNYHISQDEKLFSSIPRFFEDNHTSINPDIEHSHVQKPVFILGMPRSGTSLVEQIIASHSQVFGGGELELLNEAIEKSKWESSDNPHQVFHEIRTSYTEKLFALSDAPFLTDKMPLNFRWIGFILNTLPEAKIVHIKRNAPAVCWSNFMRYFPAPGMGFSFDLKDVANYYKLYEDLMAFWHCQFPDKIFDVSYEELTENQEEVTRNLLDFLELEWEDSVMAFHKNKRKVNTASAIQVRKKMYTGSSQEWEKYKQWLHPMLEILGQ